VSTAGLKKRLERLEHGLCSVRDDSFTLEELCRTMWRTDNEHFAPLASGGFLNYFVRQFEIEDAGRLARPHGTRQGPSV
jgi:hypothetical protein